MTDRLPHDVGALLRDLAADETAAPSMRAVAARLASRYAGPAFFVGQQVELGGMPAVVYRVRRRERTGFVYDVQLETVGSIIATSAAGTGALPPAAVVVIESVAEGNITNRTATPPAAAPAPSARVAVAAGPKPGPHLVAQ